MEVLSTNTVITNTFICDDCGAPFVYKPGSLNLVCKYCGSTPQIEQDEELVTELDFEAYMESFEEDSIVSTKVVTCTNCRATPTVDENLMSMICPYCNSPLIEQDIHQERYISPSHVSPFQINKSDVNVLLSKWARGRWFAPNKLKRAVLSPLSLHGIYMPYWTYDINAITEYTGKRGDSYEVTVSNGEGIRTERRLRWKSVSGTIQNFYDDILVSGSTRLDRKLLSSLGEWDTHNVLKINDSYLAGFITEKYHINLKNAFNQAKKRITKVYKHDVRNHIGGDAQRVYTINTKLDNVTFKHILLPIYVSSFRYKHKLYTFYVNGSNGKVSGKRPYSAIKIIFAILVGIIAAIIIYALFAG